MKKIIKILCIMLCMIMGFNVSGCYKFAGLTTIKTVEQANEYFPKYAEYIEGILDEKEIEYTVDNRDVQDDDVFELYRYYVFGGSCIYINLVFKSGSSYRFVDVAMDILCKDIKEEQAKIKESLLMFYNIVEFTNGNDNRFGEFKDYEEFLNDLFNEYSQQGVKKKTKRPYSNTLMYYWIKMEMTINYSLETHWYEIYMKTKLAEDDILISFDSRDVLSDKNIINN